MLKKSQSVSKADWGSSNIEFKNRLPEILVEIKKGHNRAEIHRTLNLVMSYRSFCNEFNKLLSPPNSSSPVFSPERKPPVAPESSVTGGGFVMPTFNIGEGEGDE